MDLWIRSQDKTVLTKTYDVRIDLHFDDKWKIQANLDRQGDYYLVGIYNSKERALEVLDDIQNALKGNVENHINKFDLYRDNNFIVYQMPES